MAFDPLRILTTLHAHGVRFVLVGGIAAVAHGSPLPTEDIDITPERSPANLDRLAAALRELDARLRVDREPDGVAFPIDGAFLATQMAVLNLVTNAGDVDLVIAPAGFANGYDDLQPGSVSVDLGDGAPTWIAALPDIIASKQAAGRTKDLAALPYLRALEAERREQAPEGGPGR
jgi:hypothetical protein